MFLFVACTSTSTSTYGSASGYDYASASAAATSADADVSDSMLMYDVGSNCVSASASDPRTKGASSSTSHKSREYSGLPLT